VSRRGWLLAALFALLSLFVLFDGLFYRIVHGELVWAVVERLGIEW
jgi:hypothetical protein